MFLHGEMMNVSAFKRELAEFSDFGRKTIIGNASFPELNIELETFTNEFWTARQRAANSIHEISYRACFKPQLPNFFISRLTSPGDTVFDPFMGRGTTLVEAALLGRVPYGCDVNPLSLALVKPRLSPPTVSEVEERLAQIDLSSDAECPDELLVFYHSETLRQICCLRRYFMEREASGLLDSVDEWIRMVAVNRLTGHSSGFFSVYTLPPNQAVSVESQRKINKLRGQTPPERDIVAIILKKTRTLLKDYSLPEKSLSAAKLITGCSSQVAAIEDEKVSLVVTSPPFLDVVNYEQDNWLRCWFIGVDPAAIKITMDRNIDDWKSSMTRVFTELKRVLKKGGFIAFEVGEVRNGKLKLEDVVIPCGYSTGLTPVLILINDQKFTKTANCWGIDNNSKGTNSNRIILFIK